MMINSINLFLFGVFLLSYLLTQFAFIPTIFSKCKNRWLPDLVGGLCIAVSIYLLLGNWNLLVLPLVGNDQASLRQGKLSPLSPLASHLADNIPCFCLLAAHKSHDSLNVVSAIWSWVHKSPTYSGWFLFCHFSGEPDGWFDVDTFSRGNSENFQGNPLIKWIERGRKMDRDFGASAGFRFCIIKSVCCDWISCSCQIYPAFW
jgi:hypothetical protein